METRLIEEYRELVERITKLDSFLGRVQNEEIKIHEEEVKMMFAQLEYMIRYRDVLQDRIIHIMITK